MDTKEPHRSKKIRVVASLTTMPDRYDKIIKTLECLNNQTYTFDAIYLSLPERSKRLNILYPPVPDEVSRLCTIVKCQDYGPITKILGALLEEKDPDTVIITFDDDMIYSPDLVSSLMKHHQKYPDSAIGSSGMLLKYRCPMCAITPNENNFIYRIPKFRVPPTGRKVDSIYGYPGALYVRKFFPSNNLQELQDKFLNYALIDDNMFFNDDIVISGYLSLHNIERRIFPNIPYVSFVLSEKTGTRIRNDNEISYDLLNFFKRMNSAIVKSKSIGMYSVTEPMDISETVAGISGIILFCIFILFVFVFCILWFDNKIFLKINQQLFF